MRTFAQEPNQTRKKDPPQSVNPGGRFFSQNSAAHSIPYLQPTIRTQPEQLRQPGADPFKKIFKNNGKTHSPHDFSKLPGCTSTPDTLQFKLQVNKLGDRYEQEADRIAQQVFRQKDLTKKQGYMSLRTAKGNTLIGENLEQRLHSNKNKGNALSSEERSFFEPRLRHDFSKVRIHTDAESRHMNRELRARAFTLGHNIYFGEGQYAPYSVEGKRLLAHELTHVLQQRGHTSFINREALPGSATTHAFSVIQYNYEQLVRRALGSLSGRLLRGATFAPLVQPILQSMLARVVWRDSHGIDHGGGAFVYSVPGTSGTSLNLTMVLDDKVNPSEAGLFRHSGTDGHLFVRVRRNTTTEALTEVLYHESMHMMSWIINTYGRTAAPGVPARAVRGLERRRFASRIAGIRRELDSLAQGVNARRRTGGRAQITASQLAQTARWLMEEIQVRAETEVFQQALQVEQQRRARARVYMATRQYGSINLAMVTRYVFEYSRTFTPADRTGMTPGEQRILRTLTQILEGFFQLHVRRRFSLRAYTMTIPRARPTFTPRPLSPPSFTERIGEATRREPF